MSAPDLVLGFHFIFSAYGFWLPNDPRGSWSDTIRAFQLLRFGEATKISTTRSVAHIAHDVQQRHAAKAALAYPPVRFNGTQARAVGEGFAAALTDHDYAIHALAVMPDHVHIIMGWHRRHIDKIAVHLKAKATMRLNKVGLHPLSQHAGRDGRLPSPWARNHWCPFIRSEKHMHVAIRYVQANPVKAGLPAQKWKLVREYC